jgi:hypothetical protein
MACGNINSMKMVGIIIYFGLALIIQMGPHIKVNSIGK